MKGEIGHVFWSYKYNQIHMIYPVYPLVSCPLQGKSRGSWILLRLAFLLSNCRAVSCNGSCGVEPQPNLTRLLTWAGREEDCPEWHTLATANLPQTVPLPTATSLVVPKSNVFRSISLNDPGLEWRMNIYETSNKPTSLIFLRTLFCISAGLHAQICPCAPH